MVGINGPVSLPAGSYDLIDLQTGLATALAAAATDRDNLVATTLKQIVKRTVVVSAPTVPSIPTPPSTPAPSVSGTLTFSKLLNRGAAVPAGTTVLNRTPGSTFTTTIAGITIDNASGAVTGTPTALSGLVTERFADGTSKDNFLYLPKATQRKMRIGQGIGGYAFYVKNLYWLDYLKAGEWSTSPATQDANGMPLTLTSNRALYIAPIDDGSVTPIKYRIITDGDFDLEGWAKESSDLVRVNRSSDRTVQLTFTAIRRAPTYMHMVRDDEAALFRSGEIFKPAFLTEMSKYAWLRWMNVHGGNIDNPILDRPDALSYCRLSVPGGLPLSIIAAFHKRTRIGLWLNVHIDTTPADFDANIKPVLLDLIASGIEVYCEYSNEVWNESFGQHYKAIEKANAAGYPGGYGYASSWWVGRATAQFAMACRGTGIRWLIGTQFGLEFILFDALLEGMNTVSGRADSDIFAYIPSGYASGSLTRYDPGGVQKTLQDQWVATGNYDAAFDNLLNYTGPVEGDRSYSAEANRPVLRAAKALADNHGWKLVVYEGNAHLNANEAPSERFLFAMSRNALMAPAIEALQEVHEEEGVYGYTHFDFGWGPSSEQSNHGVFELYGLPGYAGIERYRDTTDDSGGLSVVTPPPAQTVSGSLTFGGSGYSFDTSNQKFGAACLALNGNAAYDIVGGKVPSSGAFSIGIWLRFSEDFLMIAITQEDCFWLGTLQKGFAVYYGSGGNEVRLQSLPMNDNAWHYCELDVGPSGGTLYIDGVKVDSNTKSDVDAGVNRTANSIRIGRFAADPKYGFLGSIDDVGIFTGIRGGAVPQAAFADNAPGLVAHYSLDGSQRSGGGREEKP